MEACSSNLETWEPSQHSLVDKITLILLNRRIESVHNVNEFRGLV